MTTGIRNYPRKVMSERERTIRETLDRIPPSTGTGAPVGSSYLVVALDGTLTAERKLTAGTNISFVDGGANGNLTINASGGAGNSVTATVDFGATFTHFAEVVVTGQAWVAAGSEIVATVLAAAGTVEECALMQFSAVVNTLVAGTGFTLSVYTPTEAKGTYTFSCVGV